MSLAKGSKSKLIWAEESTYGTIPSGVAYKGALFSTESILTSIEAFKSEDIRADRTIPAIRGGNFMDGGSLTQDLGIQRSAYFLKHLLAASSIAASTFVPLPIGPSGLVKANALVTISTVANIANGDTLTAGGTTYTFKTSITTADDVLIGASLALTLINLVEAITLVGGSAGTNYGTSTVVNANVTASIGPTSNSVLFTAKTGGTSGNAITVEFPTGATDLAGNATISPYPNAPFGGTSAAQVMVINTTYTLSGGAASAQSIVRGYYYTDGGNLYLAASSGTWTTSSLSSSLATAGAQLLVGGITWQCISVGSLPTIHMYQIVAGPDFPTVGLAFEKQVLGGTQALYIPYQGGRVNSLELTIPQKGMVKAAWGILFINSLPGLTTSTAAATSTTYPTDDPVTGYDGFISMNNNLTVRPIREGTLSITNNIDENAFVIGSRSRIELPEGIRTNTGKITMYFQDNTEYQYWLTEQVVPVDVSFAHNGDFLDFHYNESKLTGSGVPQIQGPGLMTASFDINAYRENSTIDVVATICTQTASLVS